MMGHETIYTMYHMPHSSQTFYYKTCKDIYIYIYIWFISKLNWGKVNALPKKHFKMTNNWTIIFQVLTAAVVPTMAFLEDLPALFQHCARNILCLPSGWLHLAQVDVKYIQRERERERERFEGIMNNQSYGEGEDRTVLIPSQWPFTVPRTPPFGDNGERRTDACNEL